MFSDPIREEGTLSLLPRWAGDLAFGYAQRVAT
jgi:hypothetical protein